MPASHAGTNIGAVRTVEGVQIRTLRKGGGAALAAGDTVSVHYAGALAGGAAGSFFDRSFRFDGFTPEPGRGPFQFILGAGGVIPGWEIALKQAAVGDVLEIIIPPDKGYGQAGVRSNPLDPTSGYKIPPGSTLKFMVMVNGVQPPGSNSSSQSIPLPNLKTQGVNTEKLGITQGILNDLEATRVSRAGTLLADTMAADNNQSELFAGLKGADTFIFSEGYSGSGQTRDIILDFRGLDTDCPKNLPVSRRHQDNVTDFHAWRSKRHERDSADSRRSHHSWGRRGEDDHEKEGCANNTTSAAPERGEYRYDKLDLSAIDAKSTEAGNQAFSFIGKNEFTGIAGQLHYFNGLLQGDTNGDKRPDFEIELLGNPLLHQSQIIL